MTNGYDKDFKLYAVKMVVKDGKKVDEVARELDLVHQTLHQWVPSDKEEFEKNKEIRDLKNEIAIFEKLWASSQTPEVIYDFIVKDRFRVEKMCQVRKNKMENPGG